MRQLTHTPEATEPFPKGHTVATKLHNQMTGADLHPNAIDGTTGTELTAPSLTTLDGRWLKKTGGTITPTANGTSTVQVTKQDGTTAVLSIDTSGNQVVIGNGTSGNLVIGDATISKASGSFFSFGATKFSGPIGLDLKTKIAAYSITTADSTILADATSAAFQVTLPTAVGVYTNIIFTIKRTNATNNVTVGTTSSQTIDGAATKTLGAQYAWITVQSNGANWFIIGQGGTVS